MATWLMLLLLSYVQSQGMRYKFLIKFFIMTYVDTIITPSSLIFSAGPNVTVNGSSAIGNCVNEGRRTTCYSNDPTSSVLFDNPRLRGIPILAGLDGDMWASQLLTIERLSASMIAIDFHFHNNPNFTRVDRVEVVMFNCPQWGIGVESVSVQAVGTDATPISTSTIVTSCNSFMKVSLEPRTNIPQLALQFNLSCESNWVHLAEVTFWVGPSTCSAITIPLLVTRHTSSPSHYTPNRSPLPLTQRSETAITSKAVSDEEISSMIGTTMQVSTELESSNVITVTAPILLLLLVLVGAVVVVLVLWRCRDQHTAKEEASHTSSQTLTHPVVSLCEETGQVQYVSEHQHTDQDSLYSSIPIKVGQESKEVSKDDILPTEHDEMGGYDVIPFALKPSEERRKEPMINDNYALLKDVSTASPEMETQFDYTYATVDKKKGGSGNDIISMSLSAAEGHLPQPPEESPVEEAKKEEEATTTPKTAVDQLYAQVDKKKQKSKEKEVCPEESGAVYSVVNKPSPPLVPTKSQQLLEELANNNNIQC